VCVSMLFLLAYLTFILCLAPSCGSSAIPKMARLLQYLPPCLDRYCSCEYPMTWILNCFRCNMIQQRRPPERHPPLRDALRPTITWPPISYPARKNSALRQRCFPCSPPTPRVLGNWMDVHETSFEPRSITTLSR
jgi:hypothetical protein